MFVIPMAGESSRFYKSGYTEPKYQLCIDNESIFSHAVRSFERYFETDEFLFIVRQDFNGHSFVKSELGKLGIKDYKIVSLKGQTRGQAETVYLGLRDVHDSTPIFIFNIDTFRPNFEKPNLVNFCDGYLEVFVGDGEQWSFVKPGDNFLLTKKK